MAGAVLGALLVAEPRLSWAGVAVIAISVTVGEALSIKLPYGGGQVARFGHSDAVILAGMTVLPLPELVWGAAVGVAIQHSLHRPPPIKSVFNVAQITLAAAAAGAVFGLLADVGGTTVMAPTVLAPYLAAAIVFMLVNATLVGIVVATVTGNPVPSAIRRLLQPTAVLTAGGACLGLLALGLMDQHLYLLPVMGVPLLFVMAGSRQQVDAQVREERSDRLVAYERALDATRSVPEVEQALVEGVAAVANAQAAVWHPRGWSTPVPEGSAACNVHPAPGHAVAAPVGDFGIPVDAPGLAVAMDDGVLVAWGGDLGVIDDTRDWIKRLSRSASEHADRTRAHAALLQERAMLQMVVDGTSDGIYMLDADDRLRLLNPAVSSLLDVDPTRAMGSTVGRTFGAGDWTSTGVRDVERVVDGDVRVLRVAVAAVSDSGMGDMRVGVVHDVSAERRVARMKDDMLAVVSHELLTPLTPIRAAARMLSRRFDRLPTNTRSELLDQINDRTDHLTRLVEDLLLVAQLSGRADASPPVEVAEIDLAALLHSVTADADLARTQSVRYVGPDRLPARTDERRLRQIVDNLVDNACKYSDPSTTVTIELAATPHEARIAVIDAGCGIRDDDLERIFERFERAEDPLVMRTSGAGLGLYIVRSLVQALGGRLEVASSYGVGTTMTVCLPPCATWEETRPTAGVGAAAARSPR